MSLEQFPATARPRKSLATRRVVSSESNSHLFSESEHRTSDASPERARRGASRRTPPRIERSAKDANPDAALQTVRTNGIRSERTSLEESQLPFKIAPANLVLSAASAPLQKSAQLVENKHLQVFFSQSITHSLSLFSWKSFVCHSYAKHTRGVGGYPFDLAPRARPETMCHLSVTRRSGMGEPEEMKGRQRRLGMG